MNNKEIVNQQNFISIKAEKASKEPGYSFWKVEGTEIDALFFKNLRSTNEIKGKVGGFVFEASGECYKNDKPDTKYHYYGRKDGGRFTIDISTFRQDRTVATRITGSYGGDTWDTGKTENINVSSGGEQIDKIIIDWPLKKIEPFEGIVEEGTTEAGNYIIKTNDGRELVFVTNNDEWSTAKKGSFLNKDYSKKWGRRNLGF